MSVRQASGRAVYGASIVLGVLAISELIFLLLPRLQPLTDLIDLIELFIHRISPGFKETISNSLLLQILITAVLVWLAAWVALEAFSRAIDGVSLWRNITNDSCGTVRLGIRRMVCTSYKWILTIAVAPLLIIWGLLQYLSHGHRIVTVGFITIDPTTIVRYIKHIALGVALLVSLALAVFSGASH